jgi:hypothetical protein
MGEKRKEVRRLSSGQVLIKFSDPGPLEVQGRLVDVSENGFRMIHSCTTLRSGQIVEFTHIEAKGQAQVIWNRITGGAIETGFLVVG